MTETIPYTYIIGWSSQDVWYYGCRYARGCTPDDLWTRYFTSSVHVKRFCEKYGDPDIISVRKIFDSSEKAFLWESKVLRRIGAVKSERFLNKWDNCNTTFKHREGPRPFENPIIQKKVHDTFLAKYKGRGSGVESIKNKVFATNLRRYGKQTVQLEHVTNAREQANLERWGVPNPFFSKEFQEKYPNPMHDPEIRKRHAKIMANYDFTDRNSKMGKTNLERYGVINPLNTPERIEERKKRRVKCPLCNNDRTFNLSGGNITQHLVKIHNLDTNEARKIRERLVENQKNSN